MIRWAVCGSGNMASLFVNDSGEVSNGQFVAVYSKSADRAEAFAKNHQIPAIYTDFSELLNQSDIDAVYIASTHENHAPQAIQALKAGKHVLVEKPMALSAAQAEAVFSAASDNGVFCCEALWTKFSPVYQSLIEQIKDGRIGEVKHVQANFGFAIDLNQTEHRLLNPNHAGGALLDIGLYPIFLPLALLGEPTSTQAKVTLGDTGVDIAADLIMEFDQGKSAGIAYRFDAMMPTKAVISGTKGWVELESQFFAANALHWGVAGKPVRTEHFALNNRGWGNEFSAVNEAIAKGLNEAPQHTWAQSLQLANYLEHLRKTWGPSFPFEA